VDIEDPDQGREAMESSPEKKVAVKDTYSSRAFRSPTAHLVLEGYVPEFDAPVITRR